MKTIRAVLPAMLTALLVLPASGYGQTAHKSSTFTVAGHAGEAQLIQVNGKSYIEIETLARLTQGTLSFKANQTILTLPAADSTPPPPATHAKAGFSRDFIQASIEEMGVIREWRVAIVKAVQNNTPVAEDWVSAQHRLAEKNLALASSVVSTDDDRSSLPLLSAEFNNMEKLSEQYIAVRNQAAFISPDTFHSDPLEQQILKCAQDFASMTESHQFQDQPACH